MKEASEMKYGDQVEGQWTLLHTLLTRRGRITAAVGEESRLL